MLSFRLPIQAQTVRQIRWFTVFGREKETGFLSCPIFAFPYIQATLDACPFLGEKGTLWEIDLYNSVIQAVEKAFHLAWK